MTPAPFELNILLADDDKDDYSLPVSQAHAQSHKQCTQIFKSKNTPSHNNREPQYKIQ